MQQKITRRTVVAGALAGTAVLVLHKPGALAQQATPAPPSPTTSLFPGYPVLEITLTDDAVQAGSTTIPTGMVVLHITNHGTSGNSATLLGPGEGQTMDDLKAAAATPTAGDEFPPFLYNAVILGGPGELQPGQTGEALVNVTAGDWAVISEGNQPPSFVTAAESADSMMTEPTAQVHLTLGDFYFSGLDSVPAGPAIWQISNEGKQPHMVVVGKVPDGTTPEQLQATIQAMSGTPVPGALGENDFGPADAGLILLSAGKTCWVPSNLVDGTYAALCFVTDPETHQPHVMEGMATLFTVGNVATPTS